VQARAVGDDREGTGPFSIFASIALWAATRSTLLLAGNEEDGEEAGAGGSVQPKQQRRQRQQQIQVLKSPLGAYTDNDVDVLLEAAATAAGQSSGTGEARGMAFNCSRQVQKVRAIGWLDVKEGRWPEGKDTAARKWDRSKYTCDQLFAFMKAARTKVRAHLWTGTARSRSAPRSDPPRRRRVLRSAQAKALVGAALAAAARRCVRVPAAAAHGIGVPAVSRMLLHYQEAAFVLWVNHNKG
jgi:hypothetical protein